MMRQRPTSCYFCRARKLRCSKENPCTNCVSRRITCELYPSEGTASSKPSRVSKKDVSTRKEDNSDILDRLRRLEELVLKQNNPSRSTEAPQARQSVHSQPTPSDSEWLESAIMNQDSEKSIQPDKIIFKQCPINQIPRSPSYIYLNSTDPNCIGEYTKCIRIPEYKESKILLEKYLTDITSTHHVIHIPSIWLLLDELYRGLEEQKNIQLGQIVLLLSIIASTTYSWTVRDAGELFSSIEEAHEQCTFWIKASMDVLEYSRRTTSGSIEDIQAMIILTFVICNLEGISARHRNLISTSISLARELKIHRIDHPSNSSLSTKYRPDSVQAEIGRRVWWYLAATDWMLSRYAGPQEGVYTVNPQHMFVNKPLNTNDEDLFDGMIAADVNLPLSHPTTMSYFIQRIRLAELSREYTDRVPLCLSSPETVIHSTVMEIDAKFDAFVKDFPAFFCLDGSSLEEIAKKDATRAPGIIIQRYILHSLVYAHRCKLHLHNMGRGSVDPAFAHSREICLQAARMIIRTERLLEKVELPFVLARLSFSGLLYSIIMAIIVLLMDICFSRNQLDEDTRKAEVLDACSILAAAKGQSPLAGKLFEPLRKFLERQQVSVPGLNIENIDNQSSRNRYTVSASNNFVEEISNDIDSHRPDADGQFQFDEIWQLFDGGMDIETLDWNGFFSELDSQFA